MGRPWHLPEPVDVSRALLEAVGGHALLGTLLVRRGIFTPNQARAFLDPEYYTPASPEDLPGMERASDRIFSAIRNKEKICVWGDFDVDGQTSTALLVQALRELGGKIDYYIPVRERESHGINIPSLTRVIRNGASLVVTCDTGVTAHTAVDFANTHGVDMVITDHHELPEILPNSVALINPRLLNDTHPLSSLPGVGVAFKLAECLYERAKHLGSVTSLLDLVALGIIADVAILKKDTRFLAQLGLEELRRTRRTGLQMLYELAELNAPGINEEHIGYIIGPRLNALGRLSDANMAVEFLTTTDRLQARLLAIELEGLNAQRQLLTSQVYKAAITQIERDRSLLDGHALILSFPTWPAGVIGIVAGRLAEQFGKPVVMFSSPPNENARGSARSIEGVNIISAIASQKDLLVNFGGHPMAAGLSIAPENIERFAAGLSKAISDQVGMELPSRPLFIDAEVGLNDISLDLVTTIEKLAPFGAGNPFPIFIARDLSVKSKSYFGRSSEHAALTVQDSNGTTHPVIWWQGGSMSLPEEKFDLAFTLHASTYRGQKGVQLEWIDAEVRGVSIKTKDTMEKRKAEDHRNASDPFQQLKLIQAVHPDLAVWTEADDKKNIGGKHRYELTPTAHLAIFTIPPSRSEIDQVVKTVSPEVIYFLSHDPGMDNFDAFLTRLTGLVKYAIHNYDGNLDLDRLAVGCAQRTSTIEAGLRYLEVRGFIRILQSLDSGTKAILGDNNAKNTVETAELRLRALLAETKAFRNYYQTADLSGLL